MLKKIVAKLINLLSGFMKTKNVITFCSFPDYSDNPLAVYNKMLSDKRFDNYLKIWMLNQYDKYEETKKLILSLDSKAIVVKKSSLLGFYYLLVCKMHICSHGLYHEIKFKQKKPKIINVWHGMPIKVVGKRDAVYGETFENSDIILASNELYKNILSDVMCVSKDCVQILGTPRNDTFFDESNFFVANGIDSSKYSAIGAWLPTFRKNVYTEKRTDGFYCEGKIAFFDTDMLHDLDIELKKINHLLVIKLHPMDAANQTDFGKYNNIVIVNSSSPRFVLYPFLGKCDYLLTDYSSVFIDYDILSRPMGFVFDDLGQFAKNRGFLFDDIHSFLPGNFITNYEEFIDFVTNYKDKKIETGNKYNHYKDFQSTQRLLNYLYQFL